MLRYGYQIWTALTLINLLEPDQAYLPSLEADPGQPDELKMRTPKTIELGYQPATPPIRLPELVLHSPKTEQYIAFKLELSFDIPRYQGIFGGPPQRNQEMRYSGDTSPVVGERSMLFYLVEDLEEVPVIANIDKRTISQPDLDVEWTRPDEVADPYFLDKVKERYDILKPRLGAYLISRQPLGDVHLEVEGYDLHPLTVGFDSSKLQSVIDYMINESKKSPEGESPKE
jgi:hypothetical protein